MMQHIVFQNKFMRVRKKLAGDFTQKIVYAPNKEFCNCLHILAAIHRESISAYALKSCKKWLPMLSAIHFKARQSIGQREYPINIYVDSELEYLLDCYGIGTICRSHLFEKCIALEIDAQISKWGCRNEYEFISLMVSDAPLEILSRVIKDINLQVAA